MEGCAGVFGASESHEAVESDHSSEQILGGGSHAGEDEEKGKFSSSACMSLLRNTRTQDGGLAFDEEQGSKGDVWKCGSSHFFTDF